jgi:hypothetical protein
MGAPISVGQVWAVHTREGNYGVLEVTDVNIASGTSLTFNWMYQPNGTTDFTGGVGDPFVVTETFPADGEMYVESSMTTIEVYFIDSLTTMQSGDVLIEGSMSGTHTVIESVESFGIMFTLDSGGFLPGETVSVTLSGYSDAWGTIMEPYGFSFEIAAAGYSLQLTLANFDAYIGMQGYARVIGLDDGMERGRDGGLIDSSTVTIDLPGVFGDGGSFILELWVDFNQNGYFDNIPNDHGWREVYHDVSDDVVDTLFHHTDFVDIQWESEPSGGGLIMGSVIIDNIASTTTIGGYLDFAQGKSQIDTNYAHIQIDSNEGANLQPVHGNVTTVYRLLGATSDGDSIPLVAPVFPLYDGENYSTNTWDMNGTNGMPMEAGQVWALYSRGTYAILFIQDVQGTPIGEVSVSLFYAWQPNGTNDFGYNMEPWPLIVGMTGMSPYIGQILSIRIVDDATGTEIRREMQEVDADSIEASLFGVVFGGHSYTVDFYVDVNDNGMYDVPPTDHAWRLNTGVATGFTVLGFAQHTEYVDIGWPEGPDMPMLIYGDGGVDNSVDVGIKTEFERYFSFMFGLRSDRIDTTLDIIAIRDKYGPGIGYVNTVPDYGFVHLLGTGTLEDVTNVPVYDGSNYLASTYESSGPHEYTPVAVGELWAIKGNTRYAVVEIINAYSSEGFNTVEFRYLIQPDGSTDFTGEWYSPLKLLSIEPASRSFGVHPNYVVTMEFDHDIDEESLFEIDGTPKISLIGAISGDFDPFITTAPGIQGEASQVLLLPAFEPVLGEDISVWVSHSIASYDGTMLASDFETDFQISFTLPPLRVWKTWPDEESDRLAIGPAGDIFVEFSEPIEFLTMPDSLVTVYNVTTSEKLPISLSWDEFDFRLIISHSPTALGDSILVTLSPEIVAASGVTLDGGYSFGFRVRNVEPLIVRIPSFAGPNGGMVDVPVIVTDLTDQGITAFQFEVWFDTSSVAYDTISTVGTIVESSWSGGLIEASLDQSGQFVTITGSTDLGSPLMGEGTLVRLSFQHIGTGHTWMSLAPHNSYVFNEGGFPLLLQDGEVDFVDMGSIGGTVSYHQSGVPVDSVRVYLFDGEVYADTATTDTEGYYEFMDVAAGWYTLEYEVVRQIGDVDAISPMDASYILQNVVMIRDLDPVQSAAGDVTGNGDVTAYDASHVLSYTVGNISGFDGGVWVIDAYGDYFGSVDVHFGGGFLEADAEAILVGDVTANWNQQILKRPAGPARVASLDVSDASWRLRMERGAPVYGARVILTAEVPIEVAELTVMDGWISAWRSEGNQLYVSLAGTNPIVDPAELLQISPVGEHMPQLSNVEIELNDGAISADMKLVVPRQFALHLPSPNPFNPSTQVTYEIPDQSVVKLAVYNSLGQLVRTLVDTQQAPGFYRVTWNGRDNVGREMASGAYMLVLRAGGTVSHQRVMLLR